MRNLSILLLSGALLLSACARAEVFQTEVQATEQVVTTTTTVQPIPTTTTSTIPEVDVNLPQEESTTTTTVFVDFADPVRMFSEALDVDVDVSDISSSEKIDPRKGEVLWFHSDDLLGPCENGLVHTSSHLNKGEPHFNLVDDSSNDKKHGVDDKGLVVGDTVSYVLSDSTVCVYTVIEPLGVDVSNVKRIEGQPAIYFPKDPLVMNPILGSLLDIVGERPIVSMWVSYGGPGGKEFKPKPNERHRKYNAVVFAELTEVLEK